MMAELEAQHAQYVTQYIAQFYTRMLEAAPRAAGGVLSIFDILTMLGIPEHVQEAARAAWAEYQAVSDLSCPEYAGLEGLDDMV